MTGSFVPCTEEEAGVPIPLFTLDHSLGIWDPALELGGVCSHRC